MAHTPSTPITRGLEGSRAKGAHLLELLGRLPRRLVLAAHGSCLWNCCGHGGCVVGPSIDRERWWMDGSSRRALADGARPTTTTTSQRRSPAVVASFIWGAVRPRSYQLQPVHISLLGPWGSSIGAWVRPWLDRSKPVPSQQSECICSRRPPVHKANNGRRLDTHTDTHVHTQQQQQALQRAGWRATGTAARGGSGPCPSSRQAPGRGRGRCCTVASAGPWMGPRRAC